VSALARCEGCDEAIRRQGTRWVHLAPGASGGAHDHPAVPLPAPERLSGDLEVYRGRERVAVCEGIREAVETVRRANPAAAVSVSNDRRRITARFSRGNVEVVYDLLEASIRKGAMMP